MQTESHTNEQQAAREPATGTRSPVVRDRLQAGSERAAPAVRPFPVAHPRRDTLRGMLLVLLLSLLVGVLAYQSPPGGTVAVGWLGDQLFLDSSAGLGADAVTRGDFYADDLTPDAPTGRSRWTREHARLRLPDVGVGTDVAVTLLAQGWPDDVVNAAVEQPLVTVAVDGTRIGNFTPTAQWDAYTFTVPAEARTGPDLTIDLNSSATFTDTVSFGHDPRPKGLRLAAVRIRPPPTDPTAILPPAWHAVGALVLAALFLYLLLLRLLRRVTPAFVVTIGAVALLGIGLTFLRLWMGAALSVLLWGLGIALLLTWQRPLIVLLRALLRRYTQGEALAYGLLTAALAWLGYALARVSLNYQFPALYLARETFPDSLLYGLLGTGLLALTLVLGREGLPRLTQGIVGLLGSRAGALTVLLLSGGIWLGYEAMVVRDMPYVGHADYADNAVVARNLVAGRGWVVDYVTQFYQLYDGVTRPQETWPLLQPVWIAPFLAIFGEHAWAAKIPNFIFNIVLLLLIYQIGARYWDRRVGVSAALLTLTSHLFFKLTIYTTSDLGFVVFSLAAIYLLYRAVQERQEHAVVHEFSVDRRWWRRLWARVTRQRLLVASGTLTGLMMLQKPSGAVIAVGMGLWLLAQTGRRTQDAGQRLQFPRDWSLLLRRWLSVGLVWSVPALLLLSPYVVRNLLLFQTPVYSTERYDAWVLGYRGDSDEAWDEIYRVYTTRLGGPGLPDRSWILRWGFDYSFEKFMTQVQAARDYLLPAWSGLPDGLSDLVSRGGNKNLLTPTGAWLAFLGMLAALRSRRGLLSLLLPAFGLYTLFLLTYWRTNEERYFVMLLPWLALFASGILWAGFDRLAAIGDGRWSPLGLILVCVTIVSIVQPSWPEIAEKIEDEPGRWAPDLAAYTWLRENTPPDVVMMTRIPWQLNWHTGRPAVMIPYTADRAMLRYLADYYDAEYLILENQLRVKGDAAANLAPLIGARDAPVGTTVDDFTLVYASPTPDNRVLIYRFPESRGDGDAAAFRSRAPATAE